MRRLRLLFTELHETVKKNDRYLTPQQLLSLSGRLYLFKTQRFVECSLRFSLLGADPCGVCTVPVFFFGGAQRLAGVEDFWPRKLISRHV